MAVKNAAASNWSLTTRSDNRKYSRVDSTAPSAPAIVATVSGTAPASEIDLVVTPGVDANSAIVSRNIYRSLTQGGTYSLITNITGTTVTNTGLTQLTQYWYKAADINAFNLESALSTADDATTTSPQGPVPAWPTQTPSYLSVVPNAAGYGTDQFGGSGRHPTSGSHATVNTTYVMFVDRRTISGAANQGGSTFGATNDALDTSERIGFGSFGWCVEKPLPSGFDSRVIIPLVSGLIDYSRSYVNRASSGNAYIVPIYTPFITYAGQCAPSPGLHHQDITFINGPIDVGAKNGNHLLWHLSAWHSGDPMLNQAQGTIFLTAADKVLFANCLAGWAQDESFSCGVDSANPSSEVGYWQCLVMEPLGNLVKDGGANTGHGWLIIDYANKTSMTRTVGILIVQRNPGAFPNGALSVVNHLAASHGNSDGGAAADYGSSSTGTAALINHESSVLVHWPTHTTQTRPIRRGNIRIWGASSQIFWGGTAVGQNNNRQLFAPWAESDYFGGSTSGNQAARISSTWPDGLVPFTVGTVGGSDAAAREMAELCLNHVGPTPAARLPVIQRAIDFVKNRLAVNGGPYGVLLPTLASVTALIPSVAQNTISNPYLSQSEWGNRAVPLLSASRDTPHTTGAFSNGTSRVGYTRLEEFLYEVHLLRMP